MHGERVSYHDCAVLEGDDADDATDVYRRTGLLVDADAMGELPS
jgi:hypothetical protein